MLDQYFKNQFCQVKCRDPEHSPEELNPLQNLHIVCFVSLHLSDLNDSIQLNASRSCSNIVRLAMFSLSLFFFNVFKVKQLIPGLKIVHECNVISSFCVSHT